MRHGRFSVTCVLWTVLFCLRLAYAQQNVDDEEDREILYKFVTRPDIGAPKWDIEVFDQEALAPGYWFVAPYANLAQISYPLWNGLHIYDQQGGLIWSGAPLFDHKNIHDFRVQTINGVPMLTANRPVNAHRGYGEILDNTYTIVKEVDLVGNNSGPNMHDFNLIDNGRHALMLTTNEDQETEVHLDWFNGTCKVKWQGFKEVDIETGALIYEWNDKGYITLNESSFRGAKTFASFQDACSKEWDITHFNSIDQFPDGDFLLSSRHTDTIYKISHVDGSIVWRLGGIESDFVFNDHRAEFSRQHHCRVRGQNETHTLITVFDNAIGSGQEEEASSSASWGLYLALRTDVQPMTAEVIARYQHPKWDQTLLSQSRGSVQILPNENAFVGWVWESLHSEHAPDGTLLMRASLRDNSMATYRSFKYEWVGRPAQPPDVHSAATKRSPNSDALTTVVHVSWNGDTEVATWKLLHSNFNGDLTEYIASSPRQGFETRFEYKGFAKHVIAVGLDVNGKELGRSKPKMTRMPPDLQNPQVTAGELKWLEDNKWQSNPLGAFGYFTLGIVFCIAALCLAVVVILRKRAILKTGGSFWWPSRHSKYNSVPEDDEDMEQSEWMLSKEEGGSEDR